MWAWATDEARGHLPRFSLTSVRQGLPEREDRLSGPHALETHPCCLPSGRVPDTCSFVVFCFKSIAGDLY